MSKKAYLVTSSRNGLSDYTAVFLNKSSAKNKFEEIVIKQFGSMEKAEEDSIDYYFEDNDMIIWDAFFSCSLQEIELIEK